MAFISNCNYISTDAGSKFSSQLKYGFTGPPSSGSCTLCIWKPDWVSYIRKGTWPHSHTKRCLLQGSSSETPNRRGSYWKWRGIECTSYYGHDSVLRIAFLAKLLQQEKLLSIKWKAIQEVHQVDKNASRDPVTQQRTDETLPSVCIACGYHQDPLKPISGLGTRAKSKDSRWEQIHCFTYSWE